MHRLYTSADSPSSRPEHSEIEIREKEVIQLQSQVECFEQCLDKLKQEIPRYFQLKSTNNTFHGNTFHGNTFHGTELSFAKVLRSLASVQSDLPSIQHVLFLYASKNEELDKERQLMERTNKHLQNAMDNMRQKTIIPMKEITQDVQTFLKKRDKIIQSQVKKPLNSTEIQTLHTMNLHKMYIDESFDINMKMFDKHRKEGMKKILALLLHAQVRYHAKVVEELSEVIESLYMIE